jgi:hypothetical protein
MRWMCARLVFVCKNVVRLRNLISANHIGMCELTHSCVTAAARLVLFWLGPSRQSTMKFIFGSGERHWQTNIRWLTRERSDQSQFGLHATGLLQPWRGPAGEIENKGYHFKTVPLLCSKSARVVDANLKLELFVLDQTGFAKGLFTSHLN